MIFKKLKAKNYSQFAQKITEKFIQMRDFYKISKNSFK